jgi:hypothetical protein
VHTPVPLLHSSEQYLECDVFGWNVLPHVAQGFFLNT